MMHPTRLAILRELARLEDTGQPAPTWYELSIATGARSIHYHVPALEEAGLVESIAGVSRSIRVTQAGRDVLSER